MNVSAISDAAREARRFLSAYEDWVAVQADTYQSHCHTFPVATPKHTAALKRVSMDLTRSLASMRNTRSV